MKRKRIDWFDDWREWFGPRTHGIGWTAKTWKGAVAAGIVISSVITASIIVTQLLS